MDNWAGDARKFFSDDVSGETIEALYDIFKISYAKLKERLGLSPDMNVLDLGCGNGALTGAIKKHVRKITGIDIAPGPLKIAEKKNPQNAFIMADMTDLPFNTEEFELIVSITAIEFCCDRAGALKEAMRVLKPSGRLYLEVRNSAFPFRLRYPREGFYGLSYSDWKGLLEKEGFVIQNTFKSLRPSLYGSLTTRIKGLFNMLYSFLMPIRYHYIVGFLCVKR
ncbi:MAG: methyltransferase domain-containing protein [Candidatus Omnitrophica bacterium]|nr:methyltransferase domain-containing protein [Candidatus Omnitrophota bacterium]